MMTDVFDDETYEPNSIITPPSPVSPQSAGSFGNNQLLSASNRQQLSALQTPTPKASRGPSPFRATSTHAPIQSLDSSGSLIPCQGLQNNNHGLYAKLEPDPLTPRTISPGDTMFDFIEEDFESDFGLFPEIATEFDLELYGKASQETKWDKYPFSWTQAASSRSIGTHHDTAVQLQKYNDESHRQPQDISRWRPRGVSRTSSVLNSKSRPRRCDFINPDTEQPCRKTFSRPCDLVRHKKSVHDKRKRIIQCDRCPVKKMFSRVDALKRHCRNCHPEMHRY